MTTLELSAKIEQLNLSERRQVGRFIDSLLAGRSKSGSAWLESAIKADEKKLRKSDLGTRFATGYYTEEEFMSAVENSFKQAKRGETVDAFQHLADVREEYGIPA